MTKIPCLCQQIQTCPSCGEQTFKMDCHTYAGWCSNCDFNGMIMTEENLAEFVMTKIYEWCYVQNRKTKKTGHKDVCWSHKTIKCPLCRDGSVADGWCDRRFTCKKCQSVFWYLTDDDFKCLERIEDD